MMDQNDVKHAMFKSTVSVKKSQIIYMNINL